MRQASKLKKVRSGAEPGLGKVKKFGSVYGGRTTAASLERKEEIRGGLFNERIGRMVKAIRLKCKAATAAMLELALLAQLSSARPSRAPLSCSTKRGQRLRSTAPEGAA
jgi:hypothetical protein